MIYEDIERVNEEIVPVDIKGHGYATVAARVQAFRKLYPEGCIETVIEALALTTRKVIVLSSL